MRRTLIASGLLVTTAIANAEITRSPNSWHVDPNFRNDEARMELSGAACATGTANCLMVNDDKKYAQFFRIEGNQIVPDDRIGLFPDEIDGEDTRNFDGEGAAFDARHSRLYVIGSHGRTGSGNLHDEKFHLFRFPIDGQTGRPAFPFDKDDVAPEIERTDRLRETIRGQALLAPFAERCLQENGVSIEGLAVFGDDLFAGFRAPVVNGESFIMRVPLSELFMENVPAAHTKPFELGENIGIRDLAGVSDGILILAGRSSRDADDVIDECAPPQGTDVMSSIWHWSGKDADAPRNLGALPGIDRDQKAEAVLVLEEKDTSYRVLIIFDGAKNGGPVEFVVAR